MGRVIRHAALGACLGLLVAHGAAAAGPDAAPDARLAQSRALVGRFGEELLGALGRALAERGPAGAIEVCRSEAPRIAARPSAESGARVARTGVRVRNPTNAARAWERDALHDFERRLAAGEPASAIERFAVQADGGARHAKAIVTQPLCLACHGDSLAPDVREALRRHYPQDAATGFAVGQLRGAFLVEWPGKSAAPSVP